MTISMDENGTISIFQGDTGEVIISGFNPDNNYNVYFAIRNEDGALMGEELTLQSNFSDTVTFMLPATLTDELTIPVGDSYAVYYYGVKKNQVGTQEEDTLIPDLGGQKPFIVYRKAVEGRI